MNPFWVETGPELCAGAAQMVLAEHHTFKIARRGLLCTRHES